MAEEGEIELPFNIKDFDKAVQQMGDSISTISKKVDGFGKTMTDSVAKGIMKATVMMNAFVAGFKAVMKNMPEIGQAFKMASDIMSKEFFFPIRQQIMPYLQKMLDWVRDHRTLFAKWGNTVASILKVVIDTGKQLWQTFKSITDVLVNSLQKGLNTSFRSMDEFINVLSVKVSVITMYLGDLIEAMFQKISPTFEFIVGKGAKIVGFFADLASSWLSLNENGDSLFTVLDKVYSIFDKIVRVLGDSIASFFEGLVGPLKKIMTPLDNVAESFQRLLTIFGDENSGLMGAFKWIGNMVGNQLLVAFEAISVAIDTIITGIRTLAQGGNLLKDLFTGDWDALARDWDAISSLWSDYGSRTVSAGGRIWDAETDAFSIDDGIVTKDGKVIKLNPEDNVYAFKGAMGGNGGVNAPMTITINVSATEGNAQAIGQQIGVSVHQSFSERVRMQMMAGGY